MNQELSRYTPPHDLEAEQCLLGSVLLSADAFYATKLLVREEDFYSGNHRQIWLAMRDLYEQGDVGIDVVTLRDQLEQRDQLGYVGGEKILLEIMQTVPHAGNAEYYARRVVRDSVRRHSILVGEDIVQAARLQTVDPDDLCDWAQSKLQDLRGDRGTSACEMTDLLQRLEDDIVQRIETGGESGRGIATGLPTLDEVLYGLREAQLIVLAARPAMGKTALIGNIVATCARNGHACLAFILEMKDLEVVERLLCAEAKIDAQKLRTGDFDETDQYEFSAAAARMRQWPLLIDDSSESIMDICAKIRVYVRRKKVRVVVIDHLGLMEPEDKSAIREQQISAMTRKLKRLANELNITIILLCQLNRGVESRDDKRPRLADLRESGAIEQDANVVMFLHRPEAYNPEDRPGEADLIIAKNRSGPVCTIKLEWKNTLCRFAEPGGIAEGMPNDF